MATVAEQVQTAAAAFADYEDAIAAFKKTNMRGLLKQLYDERKIGYLEYQRRAAEFEAMVSTHEAATFQSHSDLTTRAIALGIDLPAVKGGGDR